MSRCKVDLNVCRSVSTNHVHVCISDSTIGLPTEVCVYITLCSVAFQRTCIMVDEDRQHVNAFQSIFIIRREATAVGRVTTFLKYPNVVQQDDFARCSWDSVAYMNTCFFAAAPG